MKSKIFRQISDVFSSYSVELADIFGHVTMQEIFIIFLVLERNDDYLLKFWALCLNSHADGMAVARPYGFEIDFVRNPFLDQPHDFSLLSLNSFLQSFLK